MFFPVYFLLFPYALFLLFFVVMHLVYLYHLLRYSAASFGTYVFLLAYGVAVVSIAGVSGYYGSMIEWGSAVAFISSSL